MSIYQRFSIAFTKLMVVFAISCSIFFGSVISAKAFSIPAFPGCDAPTGSTIAHYDNGVHGIIGRTATYQGSDTVYQINDTQALQCFCQDTAQGVQTVWWKYDSLSQNDIQVLTQQGWIYVPDGSLWGLSSAPYLAQNTDITCGDRGSGSSGQVLGLASTGGTSDIPELIFLSVLCLSLGLWLRKYRV